MGKRTIYPDNPNDILDIINLTKMSVKNVFETENGYIIVSTKSQDL